ncbi:MAG: N-acetyl-gamma-glutamyl-phosphate reductase [Saprospiraceae bacterium]|jgi:N-acetyl-gamma-glutamyl-phosphate reductase
MKKIKVNIIGAAGFVGGELIRLLAHHPNVATLGVQSNSQASKKIGAVHRDLYHSDLIFSSDYDRDADVLFISKGHGQSKKFVEQLEVTDDTVVIDMSRDFRMISDENEFVYGLPEWNKSLIKSTNRIANTGCFANAIQLAIYPLAESGILVDDIHIQGMTGSTGAGFSSLDTTHFSWRESNISVYKAFTHQHLSEVKQLIDAHISDYRGEVNFIPMRGNFTRGILVSAYTKTDKSIDELNELYAKMYDHEPFVHISNEAIDMKQVVNTNNALISVQKIDNKVLITCAIDNLLKGAAGQAVQNMNINQGFEEDTGLNLKPSAF